MNETRDTPEPETVTVTTGKLLEALRKIERGDGAYSRDPLTHAGNCIESMKAIAKAAIAEIGAE